MRQLLIILFFAITSFSCGNAGKKEKDTVTIDTNSATQPDTATQIPLISGPSNTDSTKTVTLSFRGYDEGDYAHLLFTEVGTGTEYDFGHPEGNVLGNIDVVAKNNNSSFGYRENSKMKGKKFVADLIYKTVDTHDEDGQPKKAKAWRINSIRKSE